VRASEIITSIHPRVTSRLVPKYTVCTRLARNARIGVPVLDIFNKTFVGTIRDEAVICWWYMGKPTVLIVEDDASLRDLYKDAFESEGITVLTSSFGADGVSLALNQHPDAILMDIMLPGMSGHQAVAKIREDSWGKNAVIVYLTNMADAEHVVHAVEKDASEFIVKANTTPKEVVNLVRMAMRA
jgi:CheY-like chemotaxis protein